MKMIVITPVIAQICASVLYIKGDILSAIYFTCLAILLVLAMIYSEIKGQAKGKR